MRLLNTFKKKLEEFTPDKIPPYAILSHRWESGEILFSDLQNNTARTKAAWPKVLSSCQQAQRDELKYIWIDTCCIDKSSSADLSESINSMFSWYQRAKVCYVYLSDVPTNDNIRKSDSSFASSQWFTRGWTLQELLAPRKMIFFSNDWRELGNKENISDILAAITRIPEPVLLLGISMERYSIAQRMSWASKRKTTRPEDMAYSLMGVFDINMPLLYGEGGAKAFLRLQEEIMRVSHDTSIFAWKVSKAHPVDPETQYGMLATSVEHFAQSGEITFVPTDRPPYSMTNKGIQIDLALLKAPKIPAEFDFTAFSKSIEPAQIALLDCVEHTEWRPTFLGIYVRKVWGRADSRTLLLKRVRADCLSVMPGFRDLTIMTYNGSQEVNRRQTVYVPQGFLSAPWDLCWK